MKTTKASDIKCIVHTVFPSSSDRAWNAKLFFSEDGNAISMVGVLSKRVDPDGAKYEVNGECHYFAVCNHEDNDTEGYAV